MLQIKYRRFTDGYLFASQDIAQAPFTTTKVQLCAPKELAGPAPYITKLGESVIYRFLFWSIIGKSLSPKQCVTVDSSATAWYVQETGGAGISTFAFSEDGDYVLHDSPIASVNPNGPWDGVSSSMDVPKVAIMIKAKGSIDSDPSATFDGWIQFGLGAIMDDELKVPAGGTSYAIAAYRTPVSLVSLAPVHQRLPGVYIIHPDAVQTSGPQPVTFPINLPSNT